MSGVDVLAVLDEHIGHYAALQQLARDEGNNHYADELEEHCGTLAQLRFARAAVAELIEADIAYNAAMTKRHSRAYLDCAPIKQRRIQEWLVNASKRRAAALSRVRGAE